MDSPLWKRISGALVALSALILLPAHAVRAADSNIEAPEPSDRVQIAETVTNGFIHPGIGLTKEILENARQQVLARKDPWYSGFKALAEWNPAKIVSCRNQSPTNPGKPDLDGFDNKGVEGRLRQDAKKAKQQALMYFFTGAEIYRANAMNIIRVWSQMDPTKYKSYSEVYIHCSYPIKDLMTAAELMRYTSFQDPKLAWTEKDTGDFTNNFAVPAVRTFLNQNGWFMNQNGYALAGAMSGDIFTSDRESYERRVEWFTVNKDAPNKGWSSSIHDLARLVDTNALTGEKVAKPLVQLMEMGRDQAHAGDDMEIFTNTARMMNAQQTKVDPVRGTISTDKNAVGPYEFLDDRILAAADYFCRFMFGYDTPWIPAPYDIAPNGEIRGIYPRIADNYRGRIRELDLWDIYYYYTYKKGVDLAQKTPFFYEAFTKRIINSEIDWIYIPKEATGEGARVATSVQEPPVVDVKQRSMLADHAVIVNEGNSSFVRVTPTEAGSRIVILSADTDKKTLGLRIRTTGEAELKMSGFDKPWLLPNTQGQWRYVTYTVGEFERFRDIEFLTVKGSTKTSVDIESLFRNGAEKLGAPVFRSGDGDCRLVTFVGAPVRLDFSVTAGSIGSLDKPADSLLDAGTGAFSWTPTREGKYTFVVTAADGETLAAKRVCIAVARNRDGALKEILSVYKKETPYVTATLKKYESALAELKSLKPGADNQTYGATLTRLQEAGAGLEPLTPYLPDGSMDYPRIVASSNIGPAIALLTDGNNDTFPGFYLIKGLNYIFDFGPGYQISASAFAIQGRVNFEDRAVPTAFFGSNDGKSWTQLTQPIAERPTKLTKIEVNPAHSRDRFRYLKIERLSRGGLFEPSELRIYGARYEAAATSE